MSAEVISLLPTRKNRLKQLLERVTEQSQTPVLALLVLGHLEGDRLIDETRPMEVG